MKIKPNECDDGMRINFNLTNILQARTGMPTVVDLDMIGDVEVVNSWEFIAESKLEGVDDDVCAKSSYYREKVFPEFSWENRGD